MNQTERTQDAIFLKIESIFEGVSGPLKIDAAENIDTPNANYIISVESKSQQLKITGIFRCNVFPKALLSFSHLTEEVQICLDTEKDTKIKEFLDKNYNSCKVEIERLFKLIRWKYSIGRDKTPCHSEKLFWSLEKEKWREITRCPAIEHVYGMSYNEIQFDAVMIKGLLERGESEPIFFEILREANSISYNSLESGFVIAVSALEVAVKYLIKNHSPQTQWLMDEIPSPPIEKIIREFFPILIPGFKISDKDKTLKNIVQMRNKIIHSGKVNNNRKTLFEMIDFINDFIFQTINPNLKSHV